MCRYKGKRGVERMGEAMDHNPRTCMICLRNDRVRFDVESRNHFVPHYGEAAYPLFKLSPVVRESV